MIFNNITNEQLKTKADKTDLANYLPKSGGDINGSVNVKTDENVNISLAMKNAMREVFFRVYKEGAFRLYDNTNGKNIMVCNPDGTNTFNGTATGNVPLTSGQSAPYVSTQANKVITFNNSRTDSSMAWINIDIGGQNVGAYGSKSDGTPIVWANGSTKELLHSGNVGSYALPITGGKLTGELNLDTNGATTAVIPYQKQLLLRNVMDWSTLNYTDIRVGDGVATLIKNTNGSAIVSGQLLHTGNSAKVAIQSSAPTDTTALWVW